MSAVVDAYHNDETWTKMPPNAINLMTTKKCDAV